MDWYSLVKFLHVAAAIIWLGGGFLLCVLAIRAERSNDTDAMIHNLRNTAALGNIVFMPASMLTLVFGAVLAWFWTGFSDLWILIGLAGALSTFIVGAAFIKPTAEAMMAIVDKEGMTPAAREKGRRFLQIVKYDYTVMAVVVADMVLKPGPGDYAILVPMGVLVLAGVTLFLVPWRNTETPATA